MGPSCFLFLVVFFFFSKSELSKKKDLRRLWLLFLDFLEGIWSDDCWVIIVSFGNFGLLSLLLVFGILR